MPQILRSDQIFNSIMDSSRRFEEIKIDTGRSGGKMLAQRIVAVVKKFSGCTKKLVVLKFPCCAKEFFSTFLEVATDMEELSLLGESIKRPFVLEKEFKTLRQLSIVNFLESQQILDQIPNDCLEGLSFLRPPPQGKVLEKGKFQEFLQRQTTLKKLEVYDGPRFDINHLALEKLSLCLRGCRNDHLAWLLKKYPMLFSLRCKSLGLASFNELSRLRKFEVLRTNISKHVTGELNNLQELALDGDTSSLLRVAFPKLSKLTISEVCEPIESEHFIALSRSARNLQHIDIVSSQSINLTTIIEYFQTLKTLSVDSSNCYVDHFCSTPSRPNFSLEELIIRKDYTSVIAGNVYNMINACPNIQRIQLRGVACPEPELLRLVAAHCRLTHFCCGISYQKLANSIGYPGNVYHCLEVIENFLNSPHFIRLELLGIDAKVDRHVDNLLATSAHRIDFTKSLVPEMGIYDLFLVKEYIRDPFKNFHLKRISTVFRLFKM